MSKFRELVEGIMTEYYTKSGGYTNDPQDAYDGEDEYYDWLENQDYREGYAVFVGKDEKGRDLFATADKSIPDDPDYTQSTQILGEDPDLPDVFEYSWNDKQGEEEAKRKAAEFSNEWAQHFPDAKTEIVKVYSRNEEGWEFHRTKEEVYPWEDWDYGDYLDDLRWSEADYKYDEMHEK